MRTHDTAGGTSGKALRSISLFGLGLFLVSYAVAYTGKYKPGSGINGTVHDLATSRNGMSYASSPSDPQQRVCIFCHAPHVADSLGATDGGPGGGAGPDAPDGSDYLPLWNHESSSEAASYAMYQNGPGAPQNGSRASQAIAGGMTPGSPSLRCLSCHDGSVAVNAYGNKSQMSGSQSGGGSTIASRYVIGNGKNLGDHHAIGLDYDAARSGDSEIRSADTARLGGAGRVRDHLFGPGNSRMECPTCHSVHNKDNTGDTLLWRSDQGSRLCLTCHDMGTDPGATIP